MEAAEEPLSQQDDSSSDTLGQGRAVESDNGDFDTTGSDTELALPPSRESNLSDYIEEMFIPMQTNEAPEDYIGRSFSVLRRHYANDYHSVPLLCFRNAFDMPTHIKTLEKEKQFLLCLVNTIGDPGVGFMVSNGRLNLECLKFLSRLSTCNLFYAKKGTDLIKVATTQVGGQTRMKKELAAITMSIYFQCEGFAMKTINVETGEDSSIRFEKNPSARTPWVQVQAQPAPNPELITDDMGRILYGEKWNIVKDRWQISDATRQQGERLLEQKIRKLIKKHSNRLT